MPRNIGLSIFYGQVVMKITVKLFATLEKYLPEDARNHQVTLEVPPGASVQACLDRFQIPEKLRHLVLINGVYIPPDQRMSTELKEGDVVAVWPEIAGG